MSKNKNEPKSKTETETETPPAEQQPAAETPAIKQPEVPVSDAIKIGRQSMKGDLRDVVLELFKHRMKSWQEMSEDQQRETVYFVEEALEKVINHAVDAIAGAGHAPIKGVLKGCNITGGAVKASIEVSKSQDGLEQLYEATGGNVLIVLADASEYKGERGRYNTDPDQPSLDVDNGEEEAASEGDGIADETGKAQAAALADTLPKEEEDPA